MPALFTKGSSNAKIKKSLGSGIETLILHLAPANMSGFEVCASRSEGCTMGCLNTAGYGRYDKVQQARIRRTIMWFKQRNEFKTQIVKELTTFVNRCKKIDALPSVRMNGTSDIVWERVWPELFKLFPTIQFYDYTKHYKRCLAKSVDNLPPNYHLTFSRSEKNTTLCKYVLRSGRVNVATVFDGKDFPTSLWGYPTYPAENDDLRFLDPPGGHVGCLYAKGKAKHDKTGFVLPVISA